MIQDFATLIVKFLYDMDIIEISKVNETIRVIHFIMGLPLFILLYANLIKGLFKKGK